MEPDVIDQGHRATIVRAGKGKQLIRNEEKHNLNDLNDILKRMKMNFKEGNPLS